MTIVLTYLFKKCSMVGVNFDNDRLQSLKCNPLHLTIQNKLTLSPNIDLAIPNCDICIESRLINLICNKTNYLGCFSVMHMTICSLNHNLDCLQSLIASLNSVFSVIGISEAWLQDSTHHADINGYNFMHNHCTDKVWQRCRFVYRFYF